MVGTRFNPPANLRDFDKDPQLMDRWNKKISGYFATSVSNYPPLFFGYDMLMGQNGSDRTRFGYLQKEVNNDTIEGQIKTNGISILDWVVPTGGGYFFHPLLNLCPCSKLCSTYIACILAYN
jgi:hypothetical protein